MFVDPPYRFFVDKTAELRALVGAVKLTESGLAVVEHRPKQGLGEIDGRRIIDERVYGGTVVTFYAGT